MTTKNLLGRQMRWMEVISGYDFKIELRSGKEGGKPHALTRGKQDMSDEGDERITQREIILLPPRYFSQFKEMETTEIQEEDKIQQELATDTTIQNIKQELETETKEMKGVALGLCQWKDSYL